MYEEFFQFNSRPFPPAPRAEGYFPASSIEAAHKALARCIDRGAGIGLLVGPPGSGKSTLCQVLAAEFRERFAVVSLANGPLTSRRGLLKAILFELGLPYRDMEEGDLRLSLIDHLTSSAGDRPAGMLLIVDEAHTLPFRLLDELRMITNLVRGGEPRVRLVLAGNALLEERFALPKMESFSQRLAARCYLEPFDRAETAAYVRAQFEAAGGVPSRLIDADALESVHRATDGVPRLVNQVCDEALARAAASGTQQLTAAGIEEAWAELQQLPTAWSDSPAPTSASGDVIEFGHLDDETKHETAAGDPEFVSFEPPAATVEERFDHLEGQLASFDGYETFETGDDHLATAEESRDVACTDPFDEPFDDEEVLIDRYASFSAADVSDDRHVDSTEGRELGALLRPFDSGEPSTRLVLADLQHDDDEEEDATATQRTKGHAGASVAASDADGRRFAIEDDHEIDLQFDSTGTNEANDVEPIAWSDETPDGATLIRGEDDPVLPEDDLPDTLAYHGGPPDERLAASEPAGHATRVADYPIAHPPADDSEIIIVDEDENDFEPSASGGVRRQEYHQLFANLRRR